MSNEPHLGTPYPTERYVGKAREILVVVLVWRRPPSTVLILDIEVGTHNIEGYHRHQAMRKHRSGIAHTIIGCANKGVDITGVVRSLGKGGCRRQNKEKG